jgi:hypothetical protein
VEFYSPDYYFADWKIPALPKLRHWKDIYQRIFISYPKIAKKDIPLSLF